MCESSRQNLTLRINALFVRSYSTAVNSELSSWAYPQSHASHGSSQCCIVIVRVEPSRQCHQTTSGLSPFISNSYQTLIGSDAFCIMACVCSFSLDLSRGIYPPHNKIYQLREKKDAQDNELFHSSHVAIVDVHCRIRKGPRADTTHQQECLMQFPRRFYAAVPESTFAPIV